MRVEGRRIKFVVVSDLFLEHLLHGMLHPAASSAPVDLRVVGADWDHISNSARIFVESDTFPALQEGELVSQLDVWFERAWCQQFGCPEELRPKLSPVGRFAGWECPRGHELQESS